MVEMAHLFDKEYQAERIAAEAERRLSGEIRFDGKTFPNADALYLYAWNNGRKAELANIVRCRDCRYYHHSTCYLPDGEGGFACWRAESDGFCAWGERMQDD